MYNEKIKATINNYEDAAQLSSKMANLLQPDEVKTPTFHLLPKIHKPNNRRRLVIISVDCRTSRISEFVDYYLQSAVTKSKSYVNDTTAFIKDRRR